MDDNKQEILDKNYVLNKFKDARKKDKFSKDKTLSFVFAIIFGLIVLAFIYFVSPYSKTYTVTVNGNNYLKEEIIIEEANLSDYFLLTNPKSVIKRLEKNPLIDKANVNMLDGNIVAISVEEVKAIGYVYEDDTNKLVLINDERIEINKDNLYLINKVPLIEGFNKDELLKIEKGFNKIDYSLINEISEVHRYPISYDEEQMELVMRDGNFVFISSSDLDLLEYYYSISSSVDKTKGHVCVYMDGFTRSGRISACPWQIDNNEDIENS